MTTETTCLSSVWQTDPVIKDFYEIHGRAADYRELLPEDEAYYDGMVEIDLSKVKPMIAMPFHPSHVYTIEEVNANLEDIIAQTEKMLLSAWKGLWSILFVIKSVTEKILCRAGRNCRMCRRRL